MTPHTQQRREEIARIVDPLAGWNGPGWKHHYDSHEEAVAACEASKNAALAKADAILAGDPSPGLIEALEGALANVDAADAACPVRSSARVLEKCPKCGAAANQNCGPNVGALDALEKTVRAALRQARGEAA